MADQVLPSKLVGERITVTFEFLDELQWGEAVLEASVSISVISGVDNNPTDLLYMPAVFTGTLVRQQVWRGIPGVIYLVKCTVMGTEGTIQSKVARLAILPVVNENPPLDALYLTSRPYPIVALEYMQSASLPGNGFLVERVVELMDSTFTVLSADIYGGLKSYSLLEAMDSSWGLQNVSVYGGLVGFSTNESMDSNFLVVSASLYGNLVSYSLNESVDSSFAVVSGVFT